MTLEMILAFAVGSATFWLGYWRGRSHGFRAGYLEGAETLVIGENDRLILTTADAISTADFLRLREQWDAAGRVVMLSGDIKIAAIERRPNSGGAE